MVRMYNGIIIAILFFISLGGTFIVRNVALRKSILDIPNERSSHSTPTPRGGGLAIALTWYSFLIFWFLEGKLEYKLFLALMCGLILSVISFIDDVRNLSPKIRIVSQIISSSLALVILGGLKIIDLGFIVIKIPVWLNILVLLSIVWMTNLFNFLDGIDGYLGSESLFIFLSLFIITGDILLIAFVSIIFGFLIWNWPKAKIFCGDVGSTLIGFTVMIFAIQYQNTNKLSFIIPIILSGLFWMDASITLIRRWRNKEKLSIPHKKHAYQRLVQWGYSHTQVVIYGMIINILLFLIAYMSWINEKLLLLAFLLHIIIVLIFIKFSDNKMAFK